MVSSHWRILCGTDDLWKIKCHDYGSKEGIPNITRLIRYSKSENRGIDWKLAYLELQKITPRAKKTVPIPQSLTVDGDTPDGMIRVGGKFRARDGDKSWIWQSRRKPGQMILVPRPTRTLKSPTPSFQSRENSPLSPFESSFVRESFKPENRIIHYKGQSEERIPVSENNMTKTVTKTVPSIPSIEDEEVERVEAQPIEEWIRGSHKKKPRDEDKVSDLRPPLEQANDISSSFSHLALGSSTSLSLSKAKERIKTVLKTVKPIKKVKKLQGHMDAVLCVVMDKKRLVSGSMDRTIRLWDLRTGRCVHKLYGHKGGISCMLLEAGHLYSGSWDMTVMVWDMLHFKQVKKLTGHKGSISALKMDSERLVSASHDKTVRVWCRKKLTCLQTLFINCKQIMCLALDNNNIIVGTSDKKMVSADIETGEVTQNYPSHPESVDHIVVSGRLIITANAIGQVFFWNRYTAELEAVIKCHEEAINGLAFKDGHFFTVASDGTIKEWDLVTMTCIRILQGHKGAVKDFKINNQCMVSCGADGHIRIWDTIGMQSRRPEDDDDDVMVDVVNK